MTEIDINDKMMRRCFHLARLGSHHVKTNPQVGSVITYNNKIIGEGYHKKYGGPHAEIEALNSISKEDQHLLPKSQLYVSLEPCFHHGKTPPCVDAILRAGIPKVTICNLDPNPKTHGQSVHKLRSNGVQVNIGILKDDGLELNKSFFVNQREEIPLIVLKWAQSKDGYFGKKEEQVWLSNELTQFQVHQWREEVDGILIATETAITDDPELTNRLTIGRSPHRYVLDRQGRIPNSRKILSDDLPTTVFTTNSSYQELNSYKEIMWIEPQDWNLQNIFKHIYKVGCSKLLIEGGAALHKSIIQEEIWHEARIIHTPIILGSGIKAPLISGKIVQQYEHKTDRVLIISNLSN